jgi:linoleoyl-CoA desaturase
LTLWAGTFALPYVVEINQWQFLFVYILNGLAQLFLSLNITHDSNHQAISRKPYVNRLLSFVMDMCGINSYMWRILHHRKHHSCINIHQEDEAIFGRRLFRFSPLAPRKRMHRYQHVYALPFYCLFSLDYVFIKDIEYFLFPNLQSFKKTSHPIKEYIILFVGKSLYVTYMLVLPIVVLGYSILLVGFAFLVTHFIVGLLTMLVFQTTHVIQTSRFPKGRTDFENFVYHIFATTADYAPRSALVTWLVGGLNLHVVHHLCPNVCHTHYPQLTKIVKETAEEYHVPYRENATIWQALVQHLALLKQLGRGDEIAQTEWHALGSVGTRPS